MGGLAGFLGRGFGALARSSETDLIGKQSRICTRRINRVGGRRTSRYHDRVNGAGRDGFPAPKMNRRIT
jgi:hypothetical protein